MKNWKEHLKDADLFYKTLYPKSAISIPNFADEKMELAKDTELSLYDLNRKLEYYTAWMAFLRNRAMRWEVVYKYMDELFKYQYAETYKNSEAKTIADKKNDAIVQTREITIAKVFAEGKFKAHEAEADVAKDQRDLISRQLTSKGFEMTRGVH